MKQVASPGSMHDTGCLGLVHWDDPEGWYGEGGGRRVQDRSTCIPWWIHFDIWQNQYNIVKLKNKINYSLHLDGRMCNTASESACPPQPRKSKGIKLGRKKNFFLCLHRSYEFHNHKNIMTSLFIMNLTKLLKTSIIFGTQLSL